MTVEGFTQARPAAVPRFAGVLTDRGLAEDIVREALVRAHGRWPGGAGSPGFRRVS